MAEFKYKARDKFGKLIIGSMSVINKDVVAKELISMGYTPVSIQLEVIKQSKFLRNYFNRLISGFSRVKLEEINVFTRQFHALTKAGLTITETLTAIYNQTRNKLLKDTIIQIQNDIKSGMSISDSFSRHPRVFNDLYVNMIKTGESGGNLEEVLNRLLLLFEYEIDLRHRIRSATLYPILVVVAISIAFGVIVSFVIPRFSSVYSAYSADLPGPTKLMMLINGIIKKWGFLILFLFIGLLIACIRFINTTTGRGFWDNFKLKVPIFGKLILIISMSRFARITAILMRSGIPILELLDLTSRTIGNVVIARAINQIKLSVDQGKGLAEPMRLSGIFSPIVVSMVAVGEQIGKVDELLLNVADYYDQETQYTVKNLTTYIEPILIAILGAMVLSLALAVVLPMWRYIDIFPGR